MTGPLSSKQSSLDRARSWARRPDLAPRLWLAKTSVAAAWLGLALAILSPPRGFGVAVCWFHSATGLPCPGCGLTRSLSCGIRGRFVESWQYHPMGLAVLALFCFTAIYSLSPGATRSRIRNFMQARASFFNTLYLLFGSVFVSFGLVRALYYCGARWLPL